MNFLPYEDTILTTQLSTEEAMNQLRKYLDTYRWKNPYKYQGSIDDNTFRLIPVDRRPVRHSRSFFEIIGELHTSNGETVIDITMEIGRPIKVFWMFWCFFIIGMTIIVLIEPPGVEIVNADYPILKASIFLLFPYIIAMYTFNKETSEVKEHLARIFEAKIKRT